MKSLFINKNNISIRVNFDLCVKCISFEQLGVQIGEVTVVKRDETAAISHLGCKDNELNTCQSV